MTQKIFMDKYWFIREYHTNGRSSVDIASELGVDSSSVRRHMDAIGIPRRGMSEIVHNRRANHVELPSQAREFMDGEMLGDGGIYNQSKWAARWQQVNHHREYSQFISDRLRSFGVEQCGTIHFVTSNKGGSGHYYMSKSYVEMLPERMRWYPKGIKVVPEDIVLTSTAVRQWYLGDGSLSCNGKKGGNGMRIRLACCAFGIPTSNRLAFQIAGYSGIPRNDIRITKRGDLSICKRESIKAFLEYIGPCPEPIISVYGYKWELGVLGAERRNGHRPDPSGVGPQPGRDDLALRWHQP